MENVTDALNMGFAVLAFVIALSVSIVAFGEVRAASQSIIDSKDRETSYTYIEPDQTNATRIVTREDIIPALYRAYDENYIVRFEGIGSLFEISLANSTEKKKTSTIDFSTQTIGTGDKEVFLKALLDGDNTLINGNYRFNWVQNLQNPGLYDIIGENTFEERIGIFYQDDSGDNVDEVNKTEKRIITYTKTP